MTSKERNQYLAELNKRYAAVLVKKLTLRELRRRSNSELVDWILELHHEATDTEELNRVIREGLLLAVEIKQREIDRLRERCRITEANTGAAHE